MASLAQLNFNGIRRLGSSESGDAVSLDSNFYKVSINMSKISQYSVILDPPADDIRTKLLSAHKNDIKNQLKCSEVVISGGILLAQDAKKSEASFNLDKDATSYNVILSKTSAAESMNVVRMTQFVNIVLKDALRTLRYGTIGKYQYDLRPIKVPGCESVLSLLRGYFVNLCKTSEGLALNVDLKHRILQNGTALDSIRSKSRQAAEEDLIGRAVLVQVGDKGALFRVAEILWNEKSSDKFFNDKLGKDISFEQYFKVLKQKDQPMLLVERRRGDSVKFAIKYPAELCVLTGWNDALQRHARDVAGITRMVPAKRFPLATEIIRNLITNRESSAILNAWGITVSDRPIQGTGRELNPDDFVCVTHPKEVQNILSGKPGKGIKFDPIRAQIDLRNSIGGHPAALSGKVSCKVVKIGDCTASDDVLKSLKDHVDRLKIDSMKNLFQIINAPKKNTAKDQVEEIKKALMAGGSPPQMIVLVFPAYLSDKQCTDIYCEFKRVFNGFKIATQCVKEKSLISNKPGANKLGQVIEKVVAQIVAKTSGTVFTLNFQYKLQKQLCVVGVENRDGMFSACASLRPTFTGDFYSDVKAITPGSTGRDEFKTFLKNSMNNFSEIHNSYPAFMLIYRSNVSAAQRQRMLIDDMEAFKGACAECTNLNKPVALCYVFVSTEINQKFARVERGAINNPMPLTVIDGGVTEDDRFDFYVAHQQVTQGSLTPTHYEVGVWDSEFSKMFSADDLMVFTRQLSTIYQNWPGPIRVPAPVMYARKLAKYASEVYEKKPVNLDKSLKRKLYFL